MSQEPILFNTSILENICYGQIDKDFNINDIIEVALQSNIHFKIENLPLVFYFISILILIIFVLNILYILIARNMRHLLVLKEVNCLEVNASVYQ